MPKLSGVKPKDTESESPTDSENESKDVNAEDSSTSEGIGSDTVDDVETEDGQKHEKTVSYDRFYQTNEEKKALQGQVDKLSEVLKSVMDEKSRQVPESQAEKVNPAIERARELFGDDGVAVIKELINIEKQEVTQALESQQKDRLVDDINQKLASRYRDLNDVNSNMHKLTRQKLVEFASMGITVDSNPNIVLVAADSAHKELLLKSGRTNQYYGFDDSNVNRQDNITDVNPEEPAIKEQISIGAKFGLPPSKAKEVVDKYSVFKKK